MKGTQLVLIATLAALVFVATIGARTASAATVGTVRVESATGSVGETVEADIIADVGPPGLLAWTVDPIWDEDVLSPESCTPYHGGVCSMNFASNEGRITGAASHESLIGETSLATYTFRCIAPGVARLTLDVNVFADSTVANPQDIDEDVIDGEITCVDDEHYGTLEVGRLKLPVGESGNVIVESHDMPPNGIGSWSFDIAYNPQVVAIESCAPIDVVVGDAGCDFNSDPATISVSGASLNNLGNVVFATIAFNCRKPGTTDLSATVDVWSYTTTDFDPPPPEIVPGFVVCLGPDTPGPTSTPSAGLPSTGSGPEDNPPFWFASVAALGATSLVLAAFALKRVGASR